MFSSFMIKDFYIRTNSSEEAKIFHQRCFGCFGIPNWNFYSFALPYGYEVLNVNSTYQDPNKCCSKEAKKESRKRNRQKKVYNAKSAKSALETVDFLSQSKVWASEPDHLHQRASKVAKRTETGTLVSPFDLLEEKKELPVLEEWNFIYDPNVTEMTPGDFLEKLVVLLDMDLEDLYETKFEVEMFPALQDTFSKDFSVLKKREVSPEKPFLYLEGLEYLCSQDEALEDIVKDVLLSEPVKDEEASESLDKILHRIERKKPEHSSASDSDTEMDIDFGVKEILSENEVEKNHEVTKKSKLKSYETKMESIYIERSLRSNTRFGSLSLKGILQSSIDRIEAHYKKKLKKNAIMKRLEF